MKQLHTLLILSLLYFGCSKQPVNIQDENSDLKMVSINSSGVFKGDITKVSGYDEYIKQKEDTESTTETSTTNLNKTVAQINFSSVKVAVFNSDALPYVDHTECETYTSMYNSFKGTNPLIWDDIIAGTMAYAYSHMIFSGELKKDGDFVTGDIGVKEGWNSVIIGFLNSAGEIFWQSTAYYIYYSENSTDIHAEMYESGWDSFNGNIWTATEATLTTQPATIDYAEFPYFNFNGGGFRAGLTQEYVNSICNN